LIFGYDEVQIEQFGLVGFVVKGLIQYFLKGT